MINATKMQQGKQMQGSYGKLFLALALGLVVMYPLTMAFVVKSSDFYFNISNLYMALVMVAPMGLIMLIVMRSMFMNTRLNVGLAVGFVLLFIAAFWMGRTEAFIGNDQFLRAMIPHHSRAILVCEQASITDPDIEDLCDEIIASQQREINIMKGMLGE